MIELLYRDIENLYFPKTYALNCSGILYDENRNIISYNEMINILNNCGKVVIKATMDTCSGESIRICNIEDGIDKDTNLRIETILEKYYKENYII